MMQELGPLKARLDAFARSGHEAACSLVDTAGGSFVAPNEGEAVEGFKKGDRYFVRSERGFLLPPVIR